MVLNFLYEIFLAVETQYFASPACNSVMHGRFANTYLSAGRRKILRLYRHKYYFCPT